MTYTKSQLKERVIQLYKELKNIPECELLERLICFEKICTIEKELTKLK